MLCFYRWYTGGMFAIFKTGYCLLALIEIPLEITMASLVRTTRYHASPCVLNALAPNCNEVVAASRKALSQAQRPAIRPHQLDPVKSKLDRADWFSWWLLSPCGL
jgi:hypothetical protein